MASEITAEWRAKLRKDLDDRGLRGPAEEYYRFAKPRFEGTNVPLPETLEDFLDCQVFTHQAKIWLLIMQTGKIAETAMPNQLPNR